MLTTILIVLIAVAIFGVIYFYKTKDSAAAITYGIYTTILIILWLLVAIN